MVGEGMLANRSGKYLLVSVPLKFYLTMAMQRGGYTIKPAYYTVRALSFL